MAVNNESTLDGIPLLKATFDSNIQSFSERFQEVRRNGIGSLLSRMKPTHRPSFGVLRPSFLDLNAPDAKPAHPTSWLDGVRGYASFCVFIYHFQHLFHNTFYKGYGSHDGNNDYWVVQMPIIRLLFTGAPMVSVFWVLSGVSLSLKPIQLMRNRSWENFTETMFSSVFRRWLRLFLPVLTIQVCVLIATCIGLYNRSEELQEAWPFGGTNESIHRVKATNQEQIADWMFQMGLFLNPFNKHRPTYDVHLWTIPLEFQNSVFLFVTQVGLAKLKSHVRLGFLMVFYCYCVVQEKGDLGLFLAGMGCAEILLIRDEFTRRLPTNSEKAEPESQTKRSKIIWTLVFIFGLWLLSTPAGRYEYTPGYINLVNLAGAICNGNKEMTLLRTGAAITLFAMMFTPYLRKPFATRFAVYLGKISFPLYIVHGPLAHMFGIRIVPFFWSLFGQESLFQYEFGFCLAFVIQAAMTVYVADVVMRTVDTPSVKFGRWLQNKCSV